MKGHGLVNLNRFLRRKHGVLNGSVNIQRSAYERNIIISCASISSSPSSVPGGKKEKRSKSSRLALYGQLAKFRLSSLVVMTSGAGYACYGAAIDPVTFSACTIGTALCAGSANAFNQVNSIV